MYSRQEEAKLKQEFWTVFGRYMAPVLSAEGERVAWANYKTGEKHIFFRLHADAKSAMISIDLTHPDLVTREIYFEHFKKLKNVCAEATGVEWTGHLHADDESGKAVSRFFVGLHPVSIFKKEDWPVLISFFKQGVIGLDKFWSEVKYSFELLR